MSPQTTKRFFTVAEAAGLLGLSEPTLYRAIRAGEFPAIKVRGRRQCVAGGVSPGPWSAPRTAGGAGR